MDRVEKTFATICIVLIITLFATIGGVIYAKQAGYRVLKDEIVTVVDKEYKAAYTTSGLTHDDWKNYDYAAICHSSC